MVFFLRKVDRGPVTSLPLPGLRNMGGQHLLSTAVEERRCHRASHPASAGRQARSRDRTCSPEQGLERGWHHSPTSGGRGRNQASSSAPADRQARSRDRTCSPEQGRERGRHSSLTLGERGCNRASSLAMADRNKSGSECGATLPIRERGVATGLAILLGRIGRSSPGIAPPLLSGSVIGGGIPGLLLQVRGGRVRDGVPPMRDMPSCTRGCTPPSGREQLRGRSFSRTWAENRDYYGVAQPRVPSPRWDRDRSAFAESRPRREVSYHAPAWFGHRGPSPPPGRPTLVGQDRNGTLRGSIVGLLSGTVGPGNTPLL